MTMRPAPSSRENAKFIIAQMSTMRTSLEPFRLGDCRRSNLWYCQTAYAAETEEAAIATPEADATSPAEAGCGGFSWTQLNERLAIRGDYGDSWGGEHTITQTSWVSGGASYTISQFDNEAQFIIAQNGDDNAYNPGLWSRFDWASRRKFWYCQTAYAAESMKRLQRPRRLTLPIQPKKDVAVSAGRSLWMRSNPR